MKKRDADAIAKKRQKALEKAKRMAGPEPVLDPRQPLIPVCTPTLLGNEKKYVVECLDSNWISSRGRFVDEFEERFARFCGVKFGITTNSGTTALHLALAAIGVGEGDEVIIPSFTMISTANAANYLGASLALVDAEPKTWNLDPRRIEEKITAKTKAIIPIHTYGHPADMDAILAVARKHRIAVVEDAAEAIGAEYKGKKTGGFGRIAAFSLYANKIITTGEGGIIVTDDPDLAQRARTMRNYGFTQERHFWHKVVGFSYRMTNVQAAIGLGQLERIDDLLGARIRNAELYNSLLKDVPGIVTPPRAEECVSAYWMYGILVRDEFGIGRDALRQALADRGIETRSFFIPIHLQPVYAHLYSDSYPVSEDLGTRGLYLPSSSGLKPDQIAFVAECIRQAARP